MPMRNALPPAASARVAPSSATSSHMRTPRRRRRPRIDHDASTVRSSPRSMRWRLRLVLAVVLLGVSIFSDSRVTAVPVGAAIAGDERTLLDTDTIPTGPTLPRMRWHRQLLTDGSGSAPTTPPPPTPTTPRPTSSSPPPPSPTVTPTPTTMTPAPTPSTSPPPPPPSTSPPTPAPSPTTTKPSATPPPTPPPTTTQPSPAPSTKKTVVNDNASTGSANPVTASSSTTKNDTGDLSVLSPIAGSGVIGKSSPSSDSKDSSTTSKASSGLSTMGKVGVAMLVVGVLATVVVAIVFVHARRNRHANKNDNDSTRQRQLYEFFFADDAPPIPRSGHPGAASIISANNSHRGNHGTALTPTGKIPIASSSRFKRKSSAASTATPPLQAQRRKGTDASSTRGGRFSEAILSDGGHLPVGFINSIPASPSPRGSSSDFDHSTNDSLYGMEADGSEGNSHSGFSTRSSSFVSDFASNPRSTIGSRGAAPSTTTPSTTTTTSDTSIGFLFPVGFANSRSTMVAMGLTNAAMTKTSAPQYQNHSQPTSTTSTPTREEKISSDFSIFDDELGASSFSVERGGSLASSFSYSAMGWNRASLDDDESREVSFTTSIPSDDEQPRRLSGMSFYSDSDDNRSDRALSYDSYTDNIAYPSMSESVEVGSGSSSLFSLSSSGGWTTTGGDDDDVNRPSDEIEEGQI